MTTTEDRPVVDTQVVDAQLSQTLLDARSEAPLAPLRPTPPPRPPKPPRRPPPAPVTYAPLGPLQIVLRGVLMLIAALMFAFVFNLMVLSQIQHFVSQQQLYNTYKEQLLAGTAPVSEGTFDGNLVADGAPLGVIDIPSIGMHEVIAEGTSSNVLMSGPGHRRDTVLPGQAGWSFVMGRAAAYGGPFSKIQQLAPGDTFTVTTGQGEQNFSVIGVRYAGDPVPTFKGGTSRLTLVTARGPAFIPTGIAYVDSELVSTVQPAGARQTTKLSLPPEDAAMALDTSTAWALVFALQFLLVVELAAVWSYRRIGAQKAWIVFTPLSVLAALYVSTQLAIMLPNLL